MAVTVLCLVFRLVECVHAIDVDVDVDGSGECGGCDGAHACCWWWRFATEMARMRMAFIMMASESICVVVLVLVFVLASAVVLMASWLWFCEFDFVCFIAWTDARTDGFNFLPPVEMKRKTH
jgi:hypothetical protein